MNFRTALLFLFFSTTGVVLLQANEMIPFVLPWNDQSDNETNLSWSLEPVIDEDQRVEIDENGHYRVDGNRARFFGVNIGAAACFPPQEKSTTLARRLARFGMNVVRFHHMDNTWTTTLIDYSQGNSLSLDTENLDRLDRFIAELKSAGVYSNINLLCSRVFQSGDGLHPDVDNMDWKETHILAMFDDGARNLQKAFAQEMLTHVNPYTGLSYAEDPAIAFLEINNENGLIHQWHSGAFSRMPSHYSLQLRNRWNGWLAERYTDTDELLESWEVIDEPLGQSMFTPGFPDQGSDWVLESHQGAEANLEIGNFRQGQSTARITVSNAGQAGWHVQFNRPGLNLRTNQVYTLQFWIRSHTPRRVEVSVMQAHDPWQGLGFHSTLSTGTQWQYVEHSFLLSESDTNARLNFGNLGSETGVIEISGLRLVEGGQIGTLGEGVSLENGNVPIRLPSDRGTDEMLRDWFRFLRETETEYWADMESFIRALGYRGLTWGTTIMNSTPHMQSVFRSTDSHAYWQHPQFIGEDWDPENWIVENESMVNDEEGGVIPTLAWQRVNGVPHNVTEYQHSSPNTFGSEGPLMIAAYASLQDWDGIYLFHYGSAEDDWDRGYFNGFFDIDQHSSKLANAAVASLLFRRFDLKASESPIVYPFSRELELDLMMTSGGAWNVGDGRHLGLPDFLPLVRGFALDLQPEPDSTAPVLPEVPEEMVYRSETGEITWDLSMEDKGVIRVESPRACGIIGFQAGREWSFPGMSFRADQTQQDWCTVFVIFTGGDGFQNLESGGKGLIVVTGNTENTNMGWTDATRTSVGDQWGQAPVQVENLPVNMRWEVPPDAFRVWALDERGNRRDPLPVTEPVGYTNVRLGGDTGSLWYEFEILPH